MIALYQFAKINNKTFSPYCLKVETYLQLANIAYQTVDTLPNKAPLKKLPFIDDNGQQIPDSRLIIDYLKKNYGDVLDQDLSDQQRAQGYLLCQLCEGSLIHVMLYSRWLDDKQWAQLKPMIFGRLPPVIRTIVPSLLRKKIRKKLTYQGYSDHSQAQIYDFARDDLAAIATYLSITPFAVSDKPTSFDATLYAFLSNILDKTIETPLTQALLTHQCLVEYYERVEKVLTANQTAPNDLAH